MRWETWSFVERFGSNGGNFTDAELLGMRGVHEDNLSIGYSFCSDS